jgi:hypothetical protein
MRHNTELRHTDFLKPCIKLKTLVLDYCEELDSTTFSQLLPELPHLERLQLSACVLVDDKVVEAVGNYNRKLVTLKFDRCTLITDVAPLANCPKLHSLILRGTRVVDILPLANCTSLARLDVVFCWSLPHQNVADARSLLPNTHVLSGEGSEYFSDV